MDFEELNVWRRAELARFLRKARGRAKPEVAGFEVTARRRTSGLRREEVASLAEVSTIWYTWLEQGRDIQPSGRLLGELASALQLSPSEREYLRYLGRIAQPRRSLRTQTPPELTRLLTQLPVPALMVDHRWEILGRNAGADLLLWPSEEQGEPGNVLRAIFLNQAVREMVPDWAGFARAAVSVFHTTFARNLGDIEVYRLVRELRAESPEFAELWDDQLVEANPHCVKAIRHWSAGVIRFEFVILRTFDGGTDITLFSLVPADADSAAAWWRLTDGRGDRRGLRLTEVAGQC